MINNFTIRALPGENQMQIVLDGFFMKSEVELAYHLAKKESNKLKVGFNVLADVRHFKCSPESFGMNILKLKKVLKTLGSGNMKFVGFNNPLPVKATSSVGLYPYENGWFSQAMDY